MAWIGRRRRLSSRHWVGPHPGQREGRHIWGFVKTCYIGGVGEGRYSSYSNLYVMTSW